MTGTTDEIWIHVTEAVQRAKALGATDDEARLAILERLRSSSLKARASSATFKNGWSHRTEAHWDVSEEFWFSHEAGDLEKASWYTGDFFSTRYFIAGGLQQAEETTVVGLMLRSDDVDACFPLAKSTLRAAAAEQSVSADRGGRPRDEAAWTAFWMAIVEIAKEDRLTLEHFNSKRALSDEVLASINYALGETSTKTRIRQVWVIR